MPAGPSANSALEGSERDIVFETGIGRPTLRLPLGLGLGRLALLSATGEVGTAAAE